MHLSTACYMPGSVLGNEADTKMRKIVLLLKGLMSNEKASTEILGLIFEKVSRSSLEKEKRKNQHE